MDKVQVAVPGTRSSRSFRSIIGKSLQRKMFFVIGLLFSSAVLLFIGTFIQAKQTQKLLLETDEVTFPGLMTLDKALSALENYQLRLGDALGQREIDYLEQALAYAVQIEEALDALATKNPSEQSELQKLKNSFQEFVRSNDLWGRKILEGGLVIEPTDPHLTNYREKLLILTTNLEKKRGIIYQKYQEDFKKSRAWNQGSIRTAAILLFFSLVASLLSLRYTQLQIVKPIIAMAKASLAVKQGDFTPTLGTALQDEIGQLNRNFNTMVESLSEATRRLEETNIALQNSVSNLRHEIRSRTSMVEDLAHRGNNPIHASRLNLDNIDQAILRVEETILQLLGPVAELDADGQHFFKYFHTLLQEIKSWNESSKANLVRTAEAIREIRVLSGVDGHIEEWVSLSAIIPGILHRLTENMGREGADRIQIRFSTPQTPNFLSNSLVLMVCLERLLRRQLSFGTSVLSIDIVWNEALPNQFHFLFESGQDHQPEALTDLVKSLAYILDREQVRLSLAENSYVLECLTLQR